MKVTTTRRLPIKNWASLADEKTMEQAQNLAELPFSYRHVALMPDTHVGYGMPIGGVVATEGYVIPNAVGVDIGCGMRAWNTLIPHETFMDYRHDIMNHIQRAIPTGFDHHDEMQDVNWLGFDEMESSILYELPIVHREYIKSQYQIGTLGGGNHFIEAQLDEESGQVWFMIHSGSRNVGKQVADYYNKLAVELNGRYFSSVPKEHELAFLDLRTQEGKTYMDEMQACLRFARANRAQMEKAIRKVLTWFPFGDGQPSFDIHHNYAAWENHFGKNVVVHRKGAVKAVGSDIIIPGSMGTHSFICRGLENPESFKSCSHGSGRIMGRKEAKRQISTEQVIKDMREWDIELFKVKKNDVAEECAQAYKDIDAVMKDQLDLVEPYIRLKPLAVIKG